MELWIGTSNKGKLTEFNLIAAKEKPGLVIKSANDMPSYFAPPETGKSFLENARIKARSMKAMKSGLWVMSEDSGLEVEALGNLPGIHSARYAGPKAADSENCAKLLKMMQIKAVTDRKATFLCTIVAFDPQGTEHIFEGKMTGKISGKAIGVSGFGYDPVFVPEGQDKTLAELGPAFKLANSHRTQAFKELLAKLS
jgi:XTP/dITP diphosphohydrolase